MTKRKKIIAKITIYLLIALVLFTMLSKVVYKKLLPRVELAIVKAGQIDSFVDAIGYTDFTEKAKVYAQTDCVITKVLAPALRDIKRGDPILQVDVSLDQIAVKQLELTVLTLRNQLKQVELSPEKLTAHQLQLDILNQELEVLENSQTPNKETKMKELIMQIQALEEQKKSVYNDTELAKMKAQLASLQDELTPNERLQLIRQIEALEAQILSRNYDTKLVNLKTQLLIAQDELELYQKNADIQDKIATDRLSLAILQAQTQLKSDTISQQQISEVKKQLEIANDQLKAKKASFEESGKITTLYDGMVLKYYVKEGERVVKGQCLADIATTASKPCVSFALSKEAGVDFPSGCKVVLHYTSYEKDPTSGVTFSKMNELIQMTTHKKYDETEKNYLFSATYEKDISISNLATVSVHMIRSSAVYTTILPKACVTQNEDGKDCVFMIRKKQGLFAEEKVLEEVIVKVKDRNNIYVAFDSTKVSGGDEVLLFTSKPVKDGSVISVVE